MDKLTSIIIENNFNNTTTITTNFKPQKSEIKNFDVMYNNFVTDITNNQAILVNCSSCYTASDFSQQVYKKESRHVEAITEAGNTKDK